jgi:hypothetical protein
MSARLEEAIHGLWAQEGVSDGMEGIAECSYLEVFCKLCESANGVDCIARVELIRWRIYFSAYSYGIACCMSKKLEQVAKSLMQVSALGVA